MRNSFAEFGGGTSRMLRIYFVSGGVLWLCLGGFSQQALSPSLETLNQVPLVARNLVIEYEDLGMAHSIDTASVEALDKGWVTSAGVLVLAPWFPEVVRWARAHPDSDLSLQLDLNAEWATFRWRPAAPAPPNSGLSDSAGYLPNNARYIAQHAIGDHSRAAVACPPWNCGWLAGGCAGVAGRSGRYPAGDGNDPAALAAVVAAKRNLDPRGPRLGLRRLGAPARPRGSGPFRVAAHGVRHHRLQLVQILPGGPGPQCRLDHLQDRRGK